MSPVLMPIASQLLLVVTSLVLVLKHYISTLVTYNILLMGNFFSKSVMSLVFMLKPNDLRKFCCHCYNLTTFTSYDIIGFNVKTLTFYTCDIIGIIDGKQIF